MEDDFFFQNRILHELVEIISVIAYNSDVVMVMPLYGGMEFILHNPCIMLLIFSCVKPIFIPSVWNVKVPPECKSFSG